LSAAKRVYIETYGCQMNVYDSRVIADQLRAAGYRQVRSPEDAELLLLNTCAIRDRAEQRVLGRIAELQRHKRAREGVRIGVVGCMAQRMGQELHQKRPAVDLLVGTDNYLRIPDLLRQLEQDGRPRFDLEADPRVTYEASAEADPVNNSHFISITQGCDYRCTFCVVPSTRGLLRAKAPSRVIAEVEAVVAAGGVEVTLLGQNVTAYRHAEASFAELIERVAEVEGLRRVRFLTSHPTDFPEETLLAIRRRREIAPWLHMPIQSGSDRILRRMKRGYRLRDYMAVVERARVLLEDVAFSTDVIVGFPGETEADFRATLDVMEAVGYDSAFTFKYSVRPGTPAARLTDDVSEEAKAERLARLMAWQDELWGRRAPDFLGQQWDVAIEADDTPTEGTLRARTLNNRKVRVPARPDVQVGDELRVKVTDVRGTTFYAEPVSLLRKVQDVAA
jgi:tRNA-2-methylthio-N6-dimethylallyladenosine synthase